MSVTQSLPSKQYKHHLEPDSLHGALLVLGFGTTYIMKHAMQAAA